MGQNEIDLTSDPNPASAPNPESRDNAGQVDRQKYLGVKFECCGVYSRIYPNRQGDAYDGRCPRCLKSIRFEIGPGGSGSRFFTAS